jgi:hypothetical protein
MMKPFHVSRFYKTTGRPGGNGASRNIRRAVVYLLRPVCDKLVKVRYDASAHYAASALNKAASIKEIRDYYRWLSMP